MKTRSAPVVLVVVTAIALVVAHRGIADPPATVVPTTTSAPATTEISPVDFSVVGMPVKGSDNQFNTVAQAAAAVGARPGVIHVSGRCDVAGLVIGPGGPLQIVGDRGHRGSMIADNTVLTGMLKVTGRQITFTDLIFDTPVPPDWKANRSAVDTQVTIEKSPVVVVERCMFTGSADTALKISDCGNWTVRTSLFDDIYRGLFVSHSNNGRLINCTLIDDRLGHGTNSLTTGRIEIRDSDHIVILNNALSPRDPDGKVLLLDGCGNECQSDYNIWTGVITHQYGTEQQSYWQNNFRTLDSWQAHTAGLWGTARDVHSRSEPINYLKKTGAFPAPIATADLELAGAGHAKLGSADDVDFYRQRSDHSIGCFNLDVKALLGGKLQTVQGRWSFTITFATPGRASVGVFQNDRQIRTIVSNRLFDKGPRSFDWDGCDNAGRIVIVPPGSKLEWRSVLTPETPESFDIAGPGMKLAPGCTGTTLANNPQENGEGIWCDKDGNLYQVAPYDEAGSTILSVDRDGHYRWRNWQHNGHLVTGDDKYIYVTGDDKVAKDQVVLERFPLAGCDPVPWPNGDIAIKLGTTDQLTLAGIAVIDGKLCVCDGKQNRLIVYTAGSNVIEREFKIPGYGISGLIASGDGSLITCRAGRPGTEALSPAELIRVSPDGTITTVPSDGRFFGSGLTVGPDGKLFTYNFTSVFRLGSTGEGKTDIAINHPRWDGQGGRSETGAFPVLPITSIAGSKQSLWVRQKETGYARCTLSRYDLQVDGTLKMVIPILSLEGQNGSFVDPHDPSFIYSPDFFRYHVDLASGQWDWDRNYEDIRANTVKAHVGGSTGAIFYINDQKFLAMTVFNSDTTNSRTVLICRFVKDIPYPCVAIGGKYFGADFQEKDFDPAKSGKWIWTATGNSRAIRPEETIFVESGKNKDGYPFADCTWGTYVERDGTIVWPGESMHYLRPRGLDKTGTVPVYDWSDVTTIKYQDFPDRDEKYTARVDLDGSIYDLSTTKAQPLPPGYWGMGTVLTRLSPAGKVVWSVPLNLTAKGIAVDDNFVYVASCFGPFINQYTKDGLLVRQFSWGKTDSQFGWFDFPTPINSVTDPKSGDSVLTAEEQWMGRIMVFRVPVTVTRQSGEVPN